MKRIVLFLLTSLFANLALAQTTFTRVGCGTIVDFQRIDQKWQFVDAGTRAEFTKKAAGGGDILSMLANAIPGIGAIGAAVVGTISASAVNSAVNSTRESEANDLDKYYIQNTYAVAIKPDFGDAFTFNYATNRPYKSGDRVLVMVQSEYSNELAFTHKIFGSTPMPEEFAQDDDSRRDYVNFCYGKSGRFESVNIKDGTLKITNLPKDVIEKLTN